MSTNNAIPHRKRNKSESHIDATLKQGEQREGHHRDQHNKPQHRGAHPQHKVDHSNKSEHGNHAKGDHHRDHHHDEVIRYMKISSDHHTSASSHPFRPRAGTMSRKDTALSLHHDSDRRSTGTADMFEPMVFYENTYKMEPESKFHEGQVKNIIADVLKENVTEKVYDSSQCGPKSKLLSEMIKDRVKKLNMKRFKIVSVVMIGQQSDQSMLVSSRCLWDQKKDNQVSVEFKRGDIIALGLVFAVYVE